MGQSKVAFLLSPLRVFGHISFRSDWELVKVDFRPSFPRQCGENDYSSWDLTDLQVGLATRRPKALSSSMESHRCQPLGIFPPRDFLGHPCACGCLINGSS